MTILSVNSDNIIGRNENCAPGVTSDSLSCIQLHLLVEMARAFNTDVSNNEKISLNNSLETLNPRKYKKHLLKEIGDRMGDKCTTQKCWTEQSFVKNMSKLNKKELTKYTFRPKGPAGKFEWLSTFNIDDVMRQYEKIHKDFKFLGTFPMDFDSLEYTGMKNMQFDKLYKGGKKKIGLVLNLDDHNQTGSHWVALYSDLGKSDVFYFDSYGSNPEPRVRKLMRRISRDLKKINPNANVTSDYNRTRHQYKNSECGVYSMNFIIRMLDGEGFQNICDSKVSDDEINKYRDVYFAKN